MNAIVRNTTAVPARAAAPAPMGEKTTLATITAGPAAVVQPGLARRERPEVRDVVVGRAERSRLGDIARDPADVERHERDEAAEPSRTEGFDAFGWGLLAFDRSGLL
jgi:hypothetical protein